MWRAASTRPSGKQDRIDTTSSYYGRTTFFRSSAAWPVRTPPDLVRRGLHPGSSSRREHSIRCRSGCLNSAPSDLEEVMGLDKLAVPTGEVVRAQGVVFKADLWRAQEQVTFGRRAGPTSVLIDQACIPVDHAWTCFELANDQSQIGLGRMLVPRTCRGYRGRLVSSSAARRRLSRRTSIPLSGQRRRRSGHLGPKADSPYEGLWGGVNSRRSTSASVLRKLAPPGTKRVLEHQALILDQFVAVALNVSSTGRRQQGTVAHRLRPLHPDGRCLRSETGRRGARSRIRALRSNEVRDEVCFSPAPSACRSEPAGRLPHEPVGFMQEPES